MMNPTNDKTKFVATVDPVSAAPEMLARGVIYASSDGDKVPRQLFGIGTVWWGRTTDEPAREDARSTENGKTYHYQLFA